MYMQKALTAEEKAKGGNKALFGKAKGLRTTKKKGLAEASLRRVRIYLVFIYIYIWHADPDMPCSPPSPQLAKEADAAREAKQFDWTPDVEKATSTFVKNLGTVHHRSHSVKLVIRASESVLEVAEHDEGCKQLQKLGIIEVRLHRERER